MADPAVISDAEQYRKVTKAQSELDRSRRQVSRVEAGQRTTATKARPMLAGVRSRSAGTWRSDEVARLEPELAPIEEEI